MLLLSDSLTKKEKKLKTLPYEYTLLVTLDEKTDQCSHARVLSENKVRRRESRAFSPAFSAKGSLSLEAAVICPLVMSVFFLFLQLFFAMIQESLIRGALENEARRFAHEAEDIRSFYALERAVEAGIPKAALPILWTFAQSDLEAEDDEMDLRVYYRVRFSGINLLRKRYYMADRVRIRLWTGSDMSRTEQTVYITLSGTVYHTYRDCTYLSPVVRETAVSALEQARNKNGERYTACGHCCGKPESSDDIVYVTDYGNKFHTSDNCLYINHCVVEVALSEAEGRKECSKCSQR